MGHEELTRDQHIEGSTDRAFGLVFAGVFILIAGWPLLHAQTPRWWAVVVSGGFAAIALLRPALLSGLNRQWTKLGLLLSKVVSPIALGILYYGVFVPVGVVMQLIGSDPLHLKRDAAAPTYWRRRDPPGPPPDSMTNQF